MSDDFRKQAPGKPSDHPDVFFSLSGGVDCVAAFLTAKDAFAATPSGGNFIKKPVAVYLDTRTGTPLNRLYVEELCAAYGIQLWTLRTEHSFLEWLRRDGAPGPGAHQYVRNELKERQASKLITLADNPVMILGIAADESTNRASFSKVREMDRHVEVYPVHRLTRKQRVEIILRHEDCPINPLWAYPKVIRDCGCGSMGDPSEYDVTEEHFPVFMQRLREWEEAITHDGLEGQLGWGGLAPAEKKAVESGQLQQTLTTCEPGGGCKTAREPAEVRAWKAAVEGKSRQEAIDILYGNGGVEV